MRRIRYQVAMSLDGYIAGPNGEADWILMDPDIDFGAIFSRFDTLLMGRKTFEASGGGGGMFGGMRIVVVSRTLDASKHEGVTVIADDVASAVTALRNEPGKDIWLFGAASSFARFSSSTWWTPSSRQSSRSSSAAGGRCFRRRRNARSSRCRVIASTRRPARRYSSTR
ncbi:MAG TPA: dihydrofolate reductase family protein [Thermoanaerobaculia bacterium]|nr:dihydrofolate reductase family protein [Thermoanaerobaculia bacterium]